MNDAHKQNDSISFSNLSVHLEKQTVLFAVFLQTGVKFNIISKEKNQYCIISTVLYKKNYAYCMSRISYENILFSAQRSLTQVFFRLFFRSLDVS